MSESETSLMRDNPYKLIKDYLRECQVLNSMYTLSENHWRRVHRFLTYPLIITSALSSIIAGLDIGDPYNNYILLCISLISMIIAGFNSAINPMDRVNRAHQVAGEFGELASDIKQFITENSKTKEDIKTYSKQILSQMDIWKSLAPPVSTEFKKTSMLKHARRTRKNSEGVNTIKIDM
jgi:hypothetical protein